MLPFSKITADKILSHFSKVSDRYLFSLFHKDWDAQSVFTNVFKCVFLIEL